MPKIQAIFKSQFNLPTRLAPRLTPRYYSMLPQSSVLPLLSRNLGVLPLIRHTPTKKRRPKDRNFAKLLANPETAVPITKFIQDTGRFTKEISGWGSERRNVKEPRNNYNPRQ